MPKKRYYTPVLEDNEHLLKSTDNPDRVRGLSRDDANENPDIPEWEEIDEDELYERLKEEKEPYSYDYDTDYNNHNNNEIVDAVASALATVIVTLGEEAIRQIVIPWAKETGIPWVKGKAIAIKDWVTRKIRHNESSETAIIEIEENIVPAEIVEIEKYFENYRMNMSKEEAQMHILNIMYHMFEMARELSIIANSKIKEEGENEAEYLQNKKEMELLMANMVASNLNRILSDENLIADTTSLRKIYELTNGGVRLNGEYVPVEPEKVQELIYSENKDLV